MIDNVFYVIVSVQSTSIKSEDVPLGILQQRIEESEGLTGADYYQGQMDDLLKVSGSVGSYSTASAAIVLDCARQQCLEDITTNVSLIYPYRLCQYGSCLLINPLILNLRKVKLVVNSQLKLFDQILLTDSWK